MSATKSTFKYVYIPADVNDSIQQLEMAVDPNASPEDEVLSFINKLKEHYARTGPEKTAAQKQAQVQALLQSLGSNAQNITPDLLETASGLQLVENIALLANSRANSYVGVNMYCDDEGRIKELPSNPRASELTACCGRAMDVRGDVFLARVFDNEDDFKRLDFTMADVSSSAPWMKQAREQNLRKEQRGPPEAIMEQIKERAAASKAVDSNGTSSSTTAEAEKDRGNTVFKMGNWRKAIEHYSAAIKLDPKLTTAYNNRAMAYLKLDMFAESLEDTLQVLSVEPKNVKALLRQSFALNALDRKGAALAGYKKVLELQPGNREAQEHAEELEKEQDEQALGEASAGSMAD